MTEPTSTTLLSGWIQPGECYFCGDDLSLRILGSFAGDEARISICLADARLHGFPAVPDDQIIRVLGNWLELAGAFQPSPVANEDCDPEHDGVLTVASMRLTQRAKRDPGAELSRDLARKTITALLPAAIPRVALQPLA